MSRMGGGGDVDTCRHMTDCSAGRSQTVLCRYLLTGSSSRSPEGTRTLVQLCLQPIGYQTHSGAPGRRITHLTDGVPAQVT